MTESVTTPGTRIVSLIAASSVAAAAAAAGFVTGAPTASAHPAASATASKKPPKRVTRHLTVDLNGDGHKDAVTLEASAVHGWTTKVRVSAKVGHRTVHTSYPAVLAAQTSSETSGLMFRGAAQLDGRKGKELVLAAREGAHTSFYRILTYRDHQLRTLAVPGAVNGGEITAHTWFTDSAVSSVTGIYGGNGRVTVRQGLVKPGDDTTVVGKIIHYRYRDGHWTTSSSQRHTWTQKQAGPIGGWHVPGLSTGL